MVDDEQERDEGDPGFIGGGGPIETIEPDASDDDAHLADTDHGEL